MSHHKMQVEGETAVYHAIMDRKSGETSPAERHFCPKYELAACSNALCCRIMFNIGAEYLHRWQSSACRCGSALWLYDSRWPELIHPQVD
jgi:hypothetical protein